MVLKWNDWPKGVSVGTWDRLAVRGYVEAVPSEPGKVSYYKLTQVGCDAWKVLDEDQPPFLSE